jgi:predicted nucleic acid-binding Zn ribbon protein
MQSARTGLNKVVARSLRKAPAAEVPLLAWPIACGSAVAARTRALDCIEGVLRVEVPDAGWRTELKALAPRYVATLNQYVAESITRVEFVIAGRKPAGRKPASSVPAKNPRSKRA